jgi:hypothetical protein
MAHGVRGRRDDGGRRGASGPAISRGDRAVAARSHVVLQPGCRCEPNATHVPHDELRSSQHRDHAARPSSRLGDAAPVCEDRYADRVQAIGSLHASGTLSVYAHHVPQADLEAAAVMGRLLT